MAPLNSKKRELNTEVMKEWHTKTRKRHHNSSPSSSSAASEDEEFAAVDPQNLDQDEEISEARIEQEEVRSETSSATDTDASSDASEQSGSEQTRSSRLKSKRNDPNAFASSISAILGSKLSTSKRSDPVLARSATVAQANSEIADTRLEKKARQKLREDKKEAFEKGRVKDVLLGKDAKIGKGLGPNDQPGDGEGVSVGEMQELEKRLRKTAQRGVVKLFNAVRQAQVRAEEAKKKGGPRGRKEERVGEMSKKGFLELVAGGGSEKVSGQGNIEEA